MDLLPFNSILDKFNCSICNRLLTVFPIYTMKNQNGDRILTICGRCEVPCIQKALRFTIYENLAKYFQYPCIFRRNGCMENFQPKLMKRHELTCLYRNETCCFRHQNSCQWRGSFIKLFQHCEHHHEDLFLKKNQFEFNPVEDYNVTNILLHCHELFLFIHSFDLGQNEWSFSLIPLGFDRKTQKYSSEINLKTSNTTITKIFPEINANINKLKSINVQNMMNDQNSKITGTIKIANNIEELNSMYDTEQNRKLSKLMKCHICNINIGTFYNCPGGHYVCATCRGDCCNETVADEPAKKILKLISQKCPYFCGFQGDVSQLKAHDSNCLNKPIDCIFANRTECLWRNRQMDLLKHILKLHKDKILNLNEIIELPIDIEAKKMKIIKYFHYCDCLFELKFKIKHPKIDFSIKRVTNALGNCTNFELEATFGQFQNFTIKSKRTLYHQFHKDQIVSFIADKTMRFKVRISKF